MQTASAVVPNLNRSEGKSTLLLLKSGSQPSYISEKLRNELNLPTLRRACLFIKIFGNSNSKCKRVDIVPLNVITSNKTITIEAICTPDICDPLTNQNVKAVSTNCNHLKNLKLADSSNTGTKSINILIDLDYYYLFVTGYIIRGEPNEPIALNSIFGCILCRTFVETTEANSNVTHLFRVDTLRNKTGGITKEINPFKFDFNSNYDTSEQVFPKDDHKHVLEDFEKDIQFKNNRYITKLPIRKTDDILPDNCILANNRIINLEKQLDRNKKRCADYDKIIQERNVAMFFDPLGLISPITLQPKLMLQELCRNKLEWDEVINDRNNINKWTKFLNDLGQFRLINAPRHVLCCEIGDVELHGFSDSSGKAYGACVFVRVICEHGGSVRLWTSKCRLAPVKELSIPRLELMACLLLSRLMVSVKLAVEKEVSVKNIFCWTNSQIPLW